MSVRAQRLRVTYERGEALRFVGHLDLMRFWERALRRAGLVVAYSEGFTPHPQIALGAPLPMGVTADDEMVDVFMAEPVATGAFSDRIAQQLPPGVVLRAVQEVPVGAPSLQSRVRAAEF